MSIAQPERGLPERRVITADSFRALKLRLSGGHGAAPAAADFLQAPPDVAAAVEAVSPLEPVPELPVAENEAANAPVEAAPPSEAQGWAGHASALDPAEPLAVDLDSILHGPGPEPPLHGPAQTPGDDTIANESEHHPQADAEARPVTRLAPRRPPERLHSEDPAAGEQAHALLDIMVVATAGSLPQERALANDTLLRLIPRMTLKSLRRLAERVCVMEVPSQMLVRCLIADPRIEISGPLLENATSVDDSDLIAVAGEGNPAKLRLIARRRSVSPALSEALIKTNHIDTLLNLLRNPGASFTVQSMWRLIRLAGLHPILQVPLVTREDTPSPIAFQLFWQLPSELRRYVLSRFLTDSEAIAKILTMNEENGGDAKHADVALIAGLENATLEETGKLYAKLAHVSSETGARIAEDQSGEALAVALKAAGLSRAQFAGVVRKRPNAEALKGIFDTLSFNKARVLLTYWDWAAKRTGPYARMAGP